MEDKVDFLLSRSVVTVNLVFSHCYGGNPIVSLQQEWSQLPLVWKPQIPKNLKWGSWWREESQGMHAYMHAHLCVHSHTHTHTWKHTHKIGNAMGLHQWSTHTGQWSQNTNIYLCISAWSWDPCRDKREGKKKKKKMLKTLWYSSSLHFTFYLLYLLLKHGLNIFECEITFSAFCFCTNVPSVSL